MPMKKFKLASIEKHWVLYDIGNSAFVLLVATLLPIYFNSLASSAGISEADYLAYWGYAGSIATILVAVMGPICGTLSDRKGYKKPLFLGSLALGAIGCAALGIAWGWLSFLVIFVIVLAYIFLYKTRYGHHLRVYGQNANFARYAGIGVGGVAMATRDDLMGVQASLLCNWASADVYGIRSFMRFYLPLAVKGKKAGATFTVDNAEGLVNLVSGRKGDIIASVWESAYSLKARDKLNIHKKYLAKKSKEEQHIFGVCSSISSKMTI